MPTHLSADSLTSVVTGDTNASVLRPPQETENQETAEKGETEVEKRGQQR